MGQLPMLRMLTATNGCRLSLFPRIAQIRALMRRECAPQATAGSHQVRWNRSASQKIHPG